MILLTNRWKIPFQISDEDYDLVSKHSWSVSGSGYLQTTGPILLHNFLGGDAPDGLLWDHKNRDKLDNRRENLRLVTYSQNLINQSIRSDNTTGYTGVFKHRTGDRRRIWFVRIGCKHIGSFFTLEEAISARLIAVEQYWKTS